MADRYWVGGSATWDATVGSKWATTSGGAGGAAVPTAADDVFLDGASGANTVTTSSTSVCRSIMCTGFTGALALANSTTALGIGDASGGAMTLVAGMTLTIGGTSSVINFVSTSNNGGTGWGVTSGGKTLPNVTFNGVGGKWVLQDALAAGVVTLTAGEFSTGTNQSVTATTLTLTGGSTKTLTLGSSAVILSSNTALVGPTGSPETITANTATITVTGAGAGINNGSGPNTRDWNGLSIVFTGSGTHTISGISWTLANLTVTGTAAKTDIVSIVQNLILTGTLTLTSNSVVNRLLVQSFTLGTPCTITAANVVVTNTVDFQDITGAGAATWTTGASGAAGFGDCGGNSDITFTTGVDRYGVVAGNWSNTATWSATSGGSGGASVPLVQDTVYLNASSAAGNYTIDMPRACKSIDCTNFTRTLNTSSVWTIYGSLTLASGMTFTVGSIPTFSGRDSFTITTAGKSLGVSTWTINAFGGTYTLQDAFTLPAQLTVSRGTFDTNSQTVSTLNLSASAGTACSIVLGTSTWSLTSAAASTVWNVASANTSMSADSGTIVISTTSANTRTFAGQGRTYGTLTYTVAGSTGVLVVTGSNTFGTINVGSGRTLRLPTGSATPTHVDTWNVNGIVGDLAIVDSATSGTAAYLSRTLTGASGEVWRFMRTAATPLVQEADHVDLPGVIGNYLWTADTAALSITGDIDVRVKVNLTDYTPVTSQVLVAKWASQRSFVFWLQATSGVIRVDLSPDGTNSSAVSETTAFIDSTTYWMRFTWDQGTGDVKFWQADGILTNPSGADWVQIGATGNIAIASIFDSTTSVEVGTSTNGTGNPAVGDFYAVDIRNNVLDDGTGIVALANFSRQEPVTSQYLSIRDSTAYGSSLWYAGTTSVNVSNNSGWIFTDQTNTANFLDFFE